MSHGLMDVASADSSSFLPSPRVKLESPAVPVSAALLAPR